MSFGVQKESEKSNKEETSSYSLVSFRETDRDEEMKQYNVDMNEDELDKIIGI